MCSEWLPGNTAPSETFVAVSTHGNLTFMRKDKWGQWRNAAGMPKDAPQWWFELPPAPSVSKYDGDDEIDDDGFSAPHVNDERSKG